MNEKHLDELIKQQKKTNSLLEDILKELRKENETEYESVSVDDTDEHIPELLDREKKLPFAYVINKGYIYTFCYGHCIERKQATAQDRYMYRDASAK